MAASSSVVNTTQFKPRSRGTVDPQPPSSAHATSDQAPIPAGPPNPAHPESPARSEPLSHEQLHTLTEANERRRRIDRAATVAAFNGWSTAVFAVLTLPFALFGLTALALGLGLGAVAFYEFKGRRLLRRLDLNGPPLLGFNQIAFAAILIAYSVWHIYSALTQPGRYAEYISVTPELAAMLGPIENLQKILAIAVYASIIVGTVIFQGLTAIYYFTCTRHIRIYLNETPGWVVEFQRQGC